MGRGLRARTVIGRSLAARAAELSVCNVAISPAFAVRTAKSPVRLTAKGSQRQTAVCSCPKATRPTEPTVPTRPKARYEEAVRTEGQARICYARQTQRVWYESNAAPTT